MVMPMVTDYGDVAEGAWLARMDEDSGTLQIAINGGNAATDIGAAMGDMLHIMAAEAPDMGEGMGEDMDEGEGDMGEGDMDEGDMGEGDMGSEEATTQPANE